MINEELSRSQLANARRRRIAWHEIARAIETLQAWRSYDDRGLSWVAYAGEVSGYTPTALREMLRTYNFAIDISKKVGLSSELICASIPLYALEIISRINNIDNERATDITKRYSQSKMTVGELKSTYISVKNDGSKRISNAVVGRKVSDDFEEACFNALKRPGNPIASNMYQSRSENAQAAPKFIRWVSKSTRFSPAFAIDENIYPEKTHISAADCAVIQGWSEDRIVRRLIYIDFVSKSFTRFWLIIPSWSTTDLVKKLIQQLEINKIGLVSVNPDNLDMQLHNVARFREETKRESLIDIQSLVVELALGIPFERKTDTDEEDETTDVDILGFNP